MTYEREPARLVTEPNAIGQLLRAANAVCEEPVDEVAAWRRLQNHYASRAPRKRRLFPYLAIPLAFAASALYVQQRRQPFELTADPAIVAFAHTQPTKPDSTSGNPQVEPRPIAKEVASSASASNLRPLDCAKAEQHGPPKDRVTCLELRAQGSNLEAERALFAVARIKQSELGDLPGAYAALKAYRNRFPDGALRGEIDFALVDLLPKLGRHKEALAESEALLQTPWGRARTSELRLLRARMALDHLSDCATAIREYSFIKSEFGPSGDEATLRTAECQERLGDIESAKATYQGYLARPSPARAAHAAERLRLLGDAR